MDGFRRLVRVTNTADPFIHIYKDKCVLTAAAVRLLGIEEEHRAEFLRLPNHPGIFTCGIDAPLAFPVRRRGNRGVISSKVLAKSLADALDGYGTYRICEEESREYQGRRAYEIFFRRI